MCHRTGNLRLCNEPVKIRAFPALLKKTFDSWNDHNAPRLGAALAFYTLWSMAPLVVIFVAMCSLVFSKTDAEGEVLRAARQFVGGGAAEAIHGLIASAKHQGSGVFATVVAIITLFFGASGVFIELRSSLNLIWDAEAPETFSLPNLIKDRLLSFAMIAALGLFLIASLVVSAAFALVSKFATDIVPVPAAITGELLNFVVTLVCLSLLFAVLFKFVPNAVIQWRDVVIGAVVTALLFAIGKLLLTLYLSKAAVGSTYGAAGSLVAFVVWAYYSAQIFFFGAVFTRVYADASHPGSPRKETHGASGLNRTQTA